MNIRKKNDSLVSCAPIPPALLHWLETRFITEVLGYEDDLDEKEILKAGWIRVEDSLPKEQTRVVCKLRHDRGTCYGEMYKNNWRIPFYHYKIHNEDVTHWKYE